MTRAVVVAFNDRRYGTQKGKADADGFDMVDEDGVPHAERLVQAQADRGIADQEHNFRVPKERADQVRQDAVEERHTLGAKSTGSVSRMANLPRQRQRLVVVTDQACSAMGAF